MYKLTVFTPTYNRVHLLGNLYNFLTSQPLSDFEWIIVDDGSTDQTKQVVEKWKMEEKINLSYYYQKNSGKHVAYNTAIDKAKGELFVCIDSDDIYEKEALVYLTKYWDNLSRKEDFSSLCFLSRTKEGHLIGTPFPNNEMDSNLVSIYYKYKVKGDKGLMFKTKVLKEHKFKVFENEKFITESSLYGVIGLKYKTRFINKIFEIKEYQPDGLSSKYRKLMKDNPKGALANYKILLKYDLRGKLKYKTYLQYIRFSLVDKVKVKDTIKNSPNKQLCIFLFPIGFSLYLRDKVSNK